MATMVGAACFAASGISETLGQEKEKSRPVYITTEEMAETTYMPEVEETTQPTETAKAVETEEPLIASMDWDKDDSYMLSITDLKWVKDIGYLDFVRYWGYDIQGAVYQEIVRQNTGEKLPFFIAGATKQTEPDIRIIHVTDNYLQEALHMVEMNMPRILRVKNGEVEPDRCELCDCCRHNRVLKKPISIMDLTAGI